MPVAEKITVAIATLNRPDSLARCLDALLSGNVLPAEVIVVDQSDNDATLRVVEKRRKGPVSLVYVWQAQRGLSASRNAAIRASHHPIVAMTDDDCVPDRGWIAAIEQAFAGPQAPAAVTGRILPLGPDVPGLYAVASRESTDPAQFKGRCLPWHAGSGGNFAVTRDCLRQVGPYDERLGAGSRGKAAEDLDLTHRLLRSGLTIRYVPEILVYHERQPLARRIDSRWTYGYGVGAFCGKWLRMRDGYMVHILIVWLTWRLKAIRSAMIQRQWRQAREYWLTLCGAIGGLRYGLQLRGEY